MRFLSMLVHCGVIGRVLEDERNQRDHYHLAEFEYLQQGEIALSPRLTYCVHPVMANYIGMAPSPFGRVVYPMPEQNTGYDEDELWLERVMHFE